MHPCFIIRRSYLSVYGRMFSEFRNNKQLVDAYVIICQKHNYKAVVPDIYTQIFHIMILFAIKYIL